MLPMRHCGFGRHRFARPSGPLVGGGWRLDGPNKSCLPALAICLGLAAFSSVVSVLRRIPRKAVPAALFHKQQNSEKRVTILVRGLVTGLIASVPLALSTELFAGGEWPDGPNKHWFQGLKRPDNAKHPRLGERRRRDEREH